MAIGGSGLVISGSGGSGGAVDTNTLKIKTPFNPTNSQITGGESVQLGFEKTQGQIDNLINGGNTYSQTFLSLTTLQIIHNLGRKPQVWVVNTDGQEVNANPFHINDNIFSISSLVPYNGIVYYQ